MEISDVRVRLVRESTERLKAVCSVTLDDVFVVRDVKVVEGTNGLFVAMPSRKLSAPCSRCRTQNSVRAKYCNECGQKLPPARIPADADGREKAHRDVAHPITAAFRQVIQERVLEAYRDERERAEPAEEPKRDTGRDREAERERDTGRDREAERERDTGGDREAERERDTGGDRDDEGVGDTQGAREREQLASEYDALIAGLKPGEQSDRERSGTRTDDREGSGPGPRGRRGRRGGRHRHEREDRPAEKPEPQESAEPFGGSPSDSNDGSDREEPLAVHDEQPPSESTEPKPQEVAARVEEPAEQQPVREDAKQDESASKDEDDSTPFGAGIL